jgi:hypothetical protein
MQRSSTIIEARMNDLLSRHCTNVKVNKEDDEKKWLSNVKCLDNIMHVEHHEFKEIT